MGKAENLGAYAEIDIKKFRRNRGRLSAFIMGLIAGIIHGILGILATVGLLVNSPIAEFLLPLGFGYIVIAFLLLNLVGGCIVRKYRIAGGVLMVITSLFIILYAWGFAFFTIGVSFSIVATGQLSLAASILAFIPYRKRYIQKYIERNQRPQPIMQPPNDDSSAK